ncbi:MAG: ABC transporter permease [Candidatus Limiplasma sp.]|nr:ABC transporter permease [Candidatus Limiplasma sp.]
MNTLSTALKNFGWGRTIVFLFLVGLFVVGSFFGISPAGSLTDVLVRFGMNGILVLSMVPMIQSGCGLNFGVPVGIVAGLFGAVMSLELRLTGLAGVLVAILIAAFSGAILGMLYGMLLNKVKGDEMIIATYVGLSFVFFMNILWMLLPFRNPSSVMGFKGEGLRVTISVEEYWIHVFNNFLKIQIGDKLVIPTGMLLVFALMCLILWLFFKTKTGTAITAVGSNPEYARAAGININKMRLISVMLSTLFAAVGIVVYQQSFGFIQLYNSASFFTFPSIAAILLGGASVNKASIPNVIIGTILFQGILTMTPTVINGAIQVDISEVLRPVITYSLVVIALTRGTTVRGLARKAR